jgi:hypothetical protein
MPTRSPPHHPRLLRPRSRLTRRLFLLTTHRPRLLFLSLSARNPRKL